METNFKIEKYNKDLAYSFSFGAFPTFELIKHKPKQMICLLLHSKLKMSVDIEKLILLCKENKIEIRHDDKTINRIADKENCFVVGVFKKFVGKSADASHLVLTNPSDAGNMGTIMRTMLGFDMKNLIVIKPCVDVFNPKVVRASMGAIFSLNIVEYNSVDEYLSSNKNKKFFFMLNGKKELGKFTNTNETFDLVFGNEATGLPNHLIDVDESVVIRHSKNIDSLNLPISVAMAIYEFNK
ncbi:MAG: TrmH family RNA methyltransferase [Clostridia bacterium]|nr:TrmH family RNA methyltransferase [Clostridia bacterium]